MIIIKKEIFFIYYEKGFEVVIDLHIIFPARGGGPAQSEKELAEEYFKNR